MYEANAPDEEKNGVAPDENAVISRIKKRHLQLPKSSEKMPEKISHVFALLENTGQV